MSNSIKRGSQLSPSGALVRNMSRRTTSAARQALRLSEIKRRVALKKECLANLTSSKPKKKKLRQLAQHYRKQANELVLHGYASISRAEIEMLPTNPGKEQGKPAVFIVTSA